MSRFVLGIWIGAVVVPAVAVWRIVRDLDEICDVLAPLFPIGARCDRCGTPASRWAGRPDRCLCGGTMVAP